MVQSVNKIMMSNIEIYLIIIWVLYYQDLDLIMESFLPQQDLPLSDHLTFDYKVPFDTM